MPLLRLIAEGVGPFERLDVDLSDGKGNPHLGPHIFAGVNGSGKSTVLRTLAWVMDSGGSGFSYEDWSHLTTGHANSRALVMVKPPGSSARVLACTPGGNETSIAELLGRQMGNPGKHESRLAEWARSMLNGHGLDDGRLESFPASSDELGLLAGSDQPKGTRIVLREKTETYREWSRFNVSAYSPSRALRYIATVDLTKRLAHAQANSLAFEGTVQNEVVQSWLVGLYSKRAIARDRRQSGDQYTRTLDRLGNALRLLYDDDISFDVEIEPSLQPRLKAFGHNLDFSQLPDGVRSTVGWIADFMMRQDLVQWDKKLGDERPGVLLLDEVDAHLHPLWQRKLLPAMRDALPEVQMLVTSHSPFVISSCPGARVHVLELDDKGRASVRPPVDSPIGESVTTTLAGIFGVASRFDILTERELDEWNTLKRREVSGSLPPAGKARLLELTVTLSERSEELRSIVASPRTIPQSVLRTLMNPEPAQKARRKKRA